jgi:DNA-binding MltR family transcriptional regulator
MPRAALKALSRKHLSLEELFETLEAFSNMPPQAEVLIGSSLLEDVLKTNILVKLRADLSNNDVASLFDNDAPLASFSARINMAFALNVVGEKTRADLNCIRDIRNAFAHSRVSLTFEMREVADACRTLTAPTRLHGAARMPDWPPDQPRGLFRSTIKLIWMDIHVRAAGGSPALHPP